MSYDGSGNYTVPAGTDGIIGQTIDAVVYNAFLRDLEIAMTKAYLKDGQAAILGNVNMGGYKLTNLGAGTVAGDSVRYEQLPLANFVQALKSAAYTFVLADYLNISYHHPAADTTARIWTIPANSSVAYPIGAVLHGTNGHGAGVITLAITTDTMYLAGYGTTANISVAADGSYCAEKTSATTWLVTGIGIT